MTQTYNTINDYEVFSKCKSNFDIVRGLFRGGANIPEVCKHIGISVRTFYDWKAKYPEFERATEQGREAADYSVENALYRRAVGFNYQEHKIIKRNGEVVQEEIYQKCALPDSTSCAIWLNNRMADKWKRDPERSCGDNSSSIEINVINSKDEIRKIKQKANNDKQNTKASKQKKAQKELEKNDQ